ncbi:sigma-54-dependent transcriptional regulator [Desulforhopalus singaporensis]|uniref:Sigma-54 interaction domain-containing protein n=1 Tax=Desulforhopalus singaporensis TaxID=91360 RepID=A0A1H0KNJ8_9BACT|nr:sigma 54-interacting transcriptional regulator [Desulforhopalus singaporensis]SDO57342.1 Sigma-54 interaction domain-containing protein [Desulforhopalus singaporensis]
MKPSEREFFTTVREAIFANPFGPKRVELDRSAARMPENAALAEILDRLVAKVGGTIAAVEQRDGGRALGRDDLELLKFGKLFYIFHLFCDRYDEHIRTQIKSGEECCRLNFGRDVMSMLHNSGIPEVDIVRFVSLFFQMRRAYYFISRIAGKSDCVMELRRTLWNNVFTGDIRLYDRYLWDRMEDFSTMILGETGTGKGMAAAAIGRSGYIPYNDKTHTFSESFAKTFVSINLSQFPEQLIESELFGHKKGAFTGAVENHHGIFARCSPCGAIFIDEIGDVAVPVQIKLLQVLQERSFSPVGSHRQEKFSGRVIAATNKNLETLLKTGEFREDFYYRLCSDVIEVPPLRQRLAENPEELRELLDVVVRRITGEESDELIEKTYDYILRHQPENYQWTGNIRELEQCVRRFLLKNSYDWQQAHPADNRAGVTLNNKLTAQQLLAQYSAYLYRQHGTYEEVARIMDLDRRTVRKYIQSQGS